MDLQFVLEEYAVASYVINYVGKTEAGLSKLLRNAASDAERENSSVKQKLKKIANVFLNSSLMSAQEAAYHVLSLPLSKSSRQTVFINTGPINERARMLKPVRDLQKMDKDSTDIFMEDVQTKYAKRPLSGGDICLADFVAVSATKKRITNENDDDEDDEKKITRRRKPAVIRYRRYKLKQDPQNYYREQIMLFVPWRNEMEEVEDVNSEEKYKQNLNTIERNRKKYEIVPDEVFDEALEEAQKENANLEEAIVNSFIADELPKEQQIDIGEQEGTEIAKDKSMNRFGCPKRIVEQELRLLMCKLNDSQREFVMHVLQKFTKKDVPFYTYLAGAAGVGKSMVIHCLFQLITDYFDNMPGGDKDKIVVLLCAPSGKAAYLIEGVTLHTAFALPVVQFGGNMPELSSDTANTLRQALFHVKLIIIDEISMVGSTVLSRVDTRLRQITGENKQFGGISIIAVGDLNQLPPVMDTLIFKAPKSNEMWQLIGDNPLWNHFEFYELTEVMRQKDDKLIKALNNLAVANMTQEDVQLIKSRQCRETDVPQTAIRLFAENKYVNEYNHSTIDKTPGAEHVSEAKDYILGKIGDDAKKRLLESLKNKPLTEVNGLPYTIRLKCGIKYMITSNIDVADGLVNGACGILKYIAFDVDRNPIKLGLKFDNPRVGCKARSAVLEYMKSNSIESSLTPVSKSKQTLNISYKMQNQIVRQQFSLVPAEAITIHKSQGQTYAQICVDFTKSKRITRQMMYVALSRVKNIDGLFIIGNFKPPSTISRYDPVLCELRRLRTERQLKLSFDTLKENNSPTIIYQNVLSLVSKIKCIDSDSWYRRGDILVFTETLTKPDETVDLSGYKEILRSDAKNQSRGLICFVKNNVPVTVLQHKLEYGIDCHVELVAMQLSTCSIVTGYKSPRASKQMFQETFASVMNEIGDRTEMVVLGDFNFDIRCKKSGSFLKNFFDTYGMKSVLPQDSVTTNFNTQIDVVFSTKSFEAGVYETYFSYHKPIFVKLKETVYHHAQICESSRIEATPSVPRSSQIDTQMDRFEVNIQKEVNVPLTKENLTQECVQARKVFEDSEYVQEIIQEFSKTKTVLYRSKTDRLTGDKITGFGEKNKYFKVITIRGDGNCLYRAVSYCLRRTEGHYEDLKGLCAYTIIRNRDIFDTLIRRKLIENEDFIQLINMVTTENEYGNEASIFALAMALKCEIVVIQQRQAEVDLIQGYVPVDEINGPPIFVYLTGAGSKLAHYSAVLLTHRIRIPQYEKIHLRDLIA